MQLGIYYHCYEGLDDRTRVALMKKNNFECTFLHSSSERLYEEVRLIREADITVESLHAPYPTYGGIGIDDLWLDGERGEEALSELYDCIEKCVRCEVETLIVHPTSTWHPQYPTETGLLRFERLFDRAREYGVTVAFENVCAFDVLAFLLEQFSSAGFCLDSGHEACERKRIRHLPQFGSRLKALHLHDNYLNRDLHLLPYDGKIGFGRVVRQIAESPYEGSVMLEVKKSWGGLYDSMSPAGYYARAYAAAERIERRISEIRAEKK